MSLLRNWQQITIKDLRGPWLTLEPGDVPLTNSLRAENVEYLPGLVRTRLGFTSIYTPGDKFLSMVNWYGTSFNGTQSYLIYLAAPDSTHPGMNQMVVNTGAITNIYTPAGNPTGATFAFAGYRLFMATFAPGPAGYQGVISTGTPGVWSDTSAEIINGGFDPAFLAPPACTISATDTGTGIVTAGSHQIVALFTTRNGFTTIPTTPITHVAPGGQQLNFTITPTGTWPINWTQVQLAMTQAGGAQYFIIPNTLTVVPYSTTFPINIFGVNIDDGTLALDGTDATPYFTKYTGGLNCWYVGEYSNRMVYLALDALGINTAYISNLNDFQTIYQASSVVYLPGQRPIVSAFTLYGVLYLVGPHWTYAIQDNGGAPVTWAAPQLIDGQVGTLSPNGVTVNAAQGIAWVADTAGLYMFSGGAFATKPISYYQNDDWNRINWAGAGTKVQVVDVKDKWRVHVLVPLDGATTPNYIMTWDYSRGIDAESVNYSLDSFQGFNPGAATIVQNPTPTAQDLWIGPGDTTANPLLRKALLSDPNPYRDNGQTILSAYQTALLPNLSGTIYQHHGDQLRLTGNGSVYWRVLGTDGVTQTPQSGYNTQLVEVYPGRPYTILYTMINEAASLLLVTQDPDSWFQLSEVEHYFNPFVTNR